MSNPIVIAKNITGSPITIKNLSGVTIDSSSQIDLTDIFHFYNIASSINLKTYVSNGSIVINNGLIDLNIANGLEHITIKSSYDVSQEVSYSVGHYFGNRKIYLNFGSNSNNCFESSGTSWNSSRYFLFEGSSIWTPTNIKILVSRNGTYGTSYFRLMDITNSNTIAECSWTSDDLQIINISSLTNIPVNESIFEIQVKGSTGGMHNYGNTRLHWFEIY